MAGRGRGRANTLPAWMTKQGMTGAPPPGPAPGSRPPPSAGEGPPPPPPGRNGQFDDAPEPRGPPVRNDMGEPSGGKRRSRSRGRGNDRNGDFRGPPPMQERPRSRSRDRGNGRGRGYGREDAYRRGRSRSRSRDRRDYRGDNRRGGGDRYEDRGYGYRGPREDDYRRNEGRPMRREEEAMERGYRRPASNGHDDRTTRRYASDYQPTLPGLTPTTMSPTEPANENVTGQDKADTLSNTKPREPKLLFAVAKNVANASTATRSKKEAVPDIKSPISEGKGSMRTMFGIIKRSQVLSPSTQSLRSQRSEDDVKQQPRHQEAKEIRRSSASAESENHTNVTSDSTTKPGQHFVEEVRDTLEKLLTQLDTVDPRKLLAVRLGGELRGLLGKAEDEFAAYEVEFLEHASNEGVSIALQNFGASLIQVSSIAERLRTAKFLLNRTFKGEMLFAFQEINSYYTSLFMELSMAIARRSGINLPLPPPITPPPVPEPAETPAPTGDEICLEAHQHFFGHGISKNLTKALQLYTQAADLGCATAMTCLGQMYFAGNGTEKDLLIAGKWFELASSAGEIEACHQLGVVMCEKAAHLKDTQQHDEFLAIARVRFTQAAEQGHRDAQYELGVFHENGRGGYEPNDMEAATWYLKAADQGHTAAESSLGRLFLVGTHIQHDVAKAIHFLQRAAAKNDSSAQTRLGVLFTTGNGVKPDMERGIAFLRSAADAGSSVAMTRLASLLLLSTSQAIEGPMASTTSHHDTRYRDREESHDEALRLLLSAGNGGHTDAYYRLGKLLETSSLLQDPSAALRFYSKAATAPTPHVQAAKRVATMRYSAIGCKTDKAKAHQFYTVAANAGDAEALNALGLLYEEGDGCDINYRKAVECYRSAADLNSPHAHFNLGCLLSHGKGVTRNLDAAQAHFRKATDLGYSLAHQFLLDGDDAVAAK